MVVDTSVIIEHFHKKDKTATLLYQLADEPELYVSAVTMYELYMGAPTKEKMQDIAHITGDMMVLPFNDEVALQAGRIYHKLRSTNKMIEFRDIFIAATCLTFDLPIATLNHKHFRRIDDLKILR